jgi:hypothetical protein
MGKPRTVADVDRSFASLLDAQDLRSAITAALAKRPMDEESLRRGVWTFVIAEREAGTAPCDVIVALTSLVEAASVGPMSDRRALVHRVVVWCVEAYFGHFGGAAADRDRALDSPPLAFFA